MEVKLVRLTKSFVRKNIYYADFQVVGVNLLFKGMIYNSEFKTIGTPYVFTESGTKYSSFVFPDKNQRNTLFDEMVRQIQSQPLPDLEEKVDKDVKQKTIQSIINKAKQYAKLRKELVDPPAEPQKVESPESTLPVKRKDRSPLGVWVRPSSPEAAKDAILKRGGRVTADSIMPTCGH